MVTNWSTWIEKHRTIEILLSVDFYAFLKALHFSRFQVFAEMVKCTLFHLNTVRQTQYNSFSSFLTIKVLGLLQTLGFNEKD